MLRAEILRKFHSYVGKHYYRNIFLTTFVLCIVSLLVYIGIGHRVLNTSVSLLFITHILAVVVILEPIASDYSRTKTLMTYLFCTAVSISLATAFICIGDLACIILESPDIEAPMVRIGVLGIIYLGAIVVSTFHFAYKVFHFVEHGNSGE